MHLDHCRLDPYELPDSGASGRVFGRPEGRSGRHELAHRGHAVELLRAAQGAEVEHRLDVFEREAASGIRRLFVRPFLPSPLVQPDRIAFVPGIPGLHFQAVRPHDVGDACRLAVISELLDGMSTGSGAETPRLAPETSVAFRLAELCTRVGGSA
jgi:hypothetical protein